MLGVDWLKQLGSVVTDYTTLSMKFHHLGHFVKLSVDVDFGHVHLSPKQIRRLLHTKATTSFFH